MKHKHFKHLFTALLLLCTTVATAHDFGVDGIYYNISSDKTVMVTFKGSNVYDYSGSCFYHYYSNEYTGNIIIPESVTYNSTTYSVTSIGFSAFEGCTGLTSIVIPNCVTSIGRDAFEGCTGLTSIVIPNSVTSIGGGAFEGCTGLTSIVIPNSVTSIGGGAFRGCTRLANIVIPNSVESIGEGAFYNTAWYNSQPDGVVYAGKVLYKYKGTMPQNTSIVVKDGTLSIAPEAFRGCKGLVSIEIPNSVESIGYDAFYNTAWYNSQHDGVVYAGKVLYSYKGTMPSNTSITINNGTLGIAGGAFYKCTGLTSIEIPNSVTSIGNAAFYGCTGLTSIEIPNSIKTIEYNTFNGCTGLKNVTIPNSVTSIGWYAFASCAGLTSIEIPNSVTSIGYNAFVFCSGLTNIEIPNSVTNIENSAFSSCSGLESIVVAEGNRVYDSRNDCNAIIKTATNTLVQGCLNTIIPGSVTSIGHSAFYSSLGLTSIEIPASVASIDNYAFGACSGLTSITIGAGVESIASNAFTECDNLTDVFCLATTVPTANNDAFDERFSRYMTLHVPANVINNYKTTAPWSGFGTFKPIVLVCATPIISYSSGKLLFECETEGAEFVTDIKCCDNNRYYNNCINLTATYNIAVYARANEYKNSETVNAVLCWIESEVSEDETTNDVINIPATAALITSTGGVVTVSYPFNDEVVTIYTTDGVFVGTASIENGSATISTGLAKGTIAIVTIGEKSVKIVIG